MSNLYLWVLVPMIGFNLCLVGGPFYNVFNAGILFVAAILTIFSDIAIPIWDEDYK